MPTSLIQSQLKAGECEGEVNLTVFNGLPLSSRPITNHLQHLEHKPLLAPPSIVSCDDVACATKQRKSEAISTTSNWKPLLPIVRTITRGLNYKCTQCNYTTGHAGHLKTHKLTHTNEKPFQCTHCTQSFKAEANSKAEVIRHLAVRNNQCDKCSKAFVTKQDLKKHMAAHSNKIPFKCSHPGCKASFKHSSHLTRHKKQHINASFNYS